MKKKQSTSQNLLNPKEVSVLQQSEIQEEGSQEMSESLLSMSKQGFVPESLSEQSRKLKKNSKPISVEENTLSNIEESIASSHQATKKQLTD